MVRLVYSSGCLPQTTVEDAAGLSLHKLVITTQTTISKKLWCWVSNTASQLEGHALGLFVVTPSPMPPPASRTPTSLTRREAAWTQIKVVDRMVERDRSAYVDRWAHEGFVWRHHLMTAAATGNASVSPQSQLYQRHPLAVTTSTSCISQRNS